MSQATLQRLLEYPQAAVFEKSALPELALRIRNPVGLEWVIEGDTLRLVVGQNTEFDGVIEFNGDYDWGLTYRRYSLGDKTVAELADALQADGHEVVFENPALGSRSARVLIAGSNNQDATNGDHLQGYTSLLWVLLDSYAVELEQAEAQITEALRQMVMTQAEAEWLDVWANLYGVPRLLGDRLKFDRSTTFDGSGTFDGNWDESDAHLQERLPKEVLRLRVTPFAIEDAIKDATGQVVRIDEPWKKLFTVGVSSLSGDHRMHDGEYYTYHVIQAVGGEGADMGPVMPVILRNKPAGVQVYPSRIDFPAWYVQMLRNDFVSPPVRTEFRGDHVNTFSNQLLGVMRLDAAEGEIINHRLAQLWMRFVAQAPGPDGHIGFTLNHLIPERREVAYASVCLSDGVALGDENGVLSRGIEVLTFAPQMTLSDFAFLSEMAVDRHVERVERIVLDPHAAMAVSEFTAASQAGRVDGRSDSNIDALSLGSGASAMSVVLGTTDLVFNGFAAHDGTYQFYGTRGN